MRRHLVMACAVLAACCGAVSAPAANPLGVRIYSYGKFQDEAWKHLPSIGVRNVFLSIPAPDKVEDLKKKLAASKLNAPVMRGETDWTKPTAAKQLGAQLAIARQLGAKYIFLSVKHPGVEKKVVYQRLREAGDAAKKYGVILVLETHPDLGTNGDEHVVTMKAVNHPDVRVNFDSGNITYYNTGRDAVTELKKVLPYLASYAATKAYNLVLAESLWDELRGSGVDVLALMPGATRTTGFERSGAHLERSTLAPLNEPGPTVAEALRMLGRTPSWIPGRRNRWTLTLAARLLPRRQLIRIVGSNMRQWYGK